MGCGRGGHAQHMAGQRDRMASLALPSLERWERPRLPVASLAAAQPGGFAQGPEEKKGRAGRKSGLIFVTV